jgi:broad specificity phosphatase PhoE
LGRWEGLDWETIRCNDPEAYHHFMANPAYHGYPEGESFADVHQRTFKTLDELLQVHEGQAILVVAHHVVNRTYLAGLLGLPAERARQVSLDNCGISVVVRAEEKTAVTTLNAAFHLQGVAA